ncbi:hypothetical protein Lqui_1263 [Legionella quinlivanii]|uniref:Uncharacterized protein n=1 Tax=Legionella quinlivanii TaxID=45073 RepID=A0A0W0XZW3_9GAMM|nr:hypothetical protein [Legionella quinlivanii]KTD49938.1 hypothetical protein Lqui_1263 [Legionella quinlivanii]MCW8450533.1 hypothetical protein [Legionella quinlivanii]SEF97274.1 XTP/dITP diphosphohydrolase [Legionella quinlivanii DSM 21216]STY11286.1 Uncharacterised protein [Legionella quinlivanii]
MSNNDLQHIVGEISEKPDEIPFSPDQFEPLPNNTPEPSPENTPEPEPVHIPEPEPINIPENPL